MVSIGKYFINLRHIYTIWTSLVVQTVKNLPAMQETWVQSLGLEDPLEKRMVTHSSILAWQSSGKRGLMGYSPWGYRESYTKRLKHTNIPYWVNISGGQNDKYGKMLLIVFNLLLKCLNINKITPKISSIDIALL